MKSACLWTILPIFWSLLPEIAFFYAFCCLIFHLFVLEVPIHYQNPQKDRKTPKKARKWPITTRKMRSKRPQNEDKPTPKRCQNDPKVPQNGPKSPKMTHFGPILGFVLTCFWLQKGPKRLKMVRTTIKVTCILIKSCRPSIKVHEHTQNPPTVVPGTATCCTLS